MCHPETLAEGSNNEIDAKTQRGIDAQPFTLRHAELVSASINANVKNQESGSKSKALLNDNSHTSIHPDLQTSKLAPTPALPRREGTCHCEEQSDEAIQLIKKQESGSKSKALLNDNSHTSVPLALQTSKLAPTQPSSKGRSKAAFTLAEVLITLGIIGVVAAMTLPTLIQNYKEKQTVTKLKKVYSILNNAYLLARNENSDVTNWLTGGSNKNNAQIFAEKMKPYLNISKDCGFEPGCFTKGKVKTLDGRDYVDYDNNEREYRIILSDGTAVMFYIAPSDYIGNIKVDIDGYKGKYTIGEDFFIFIINQKSIEPYGKAGDTLSLEEGCNKSNSSTTGNGISCTAWVIFNENMDYLHCDDLSWDGKHTCK